jgi:hypothetical protein
MFQFIQANLALHAVAAMLVLAIAVKEAVFYRR